MFYRRNAESLLRQLYRNWQKSGLEEDFRRWFNVADRAQDPSADAYRCDVPTCPQHTAGTLNLIHCYDCPWEHKVCYACASDIIVGVPSPGYHYDELRSVEVSDERHHYISRCSCRCHQGIPGWSKENARWVCTDVLAKALYNTKLNVGSCATVINSDVQEYPSADDPGSTVRCRDCAYYNCPYAKMLEFNAASTTPQEEYPPTDYHPGEFIDHPEDEYDDGWEW